MQSGQLLSSPQILTRASRRQRLVAGVVFLSIVAGFAACWVIARYKIPIYPFGCGFKQRYGLPCPTCGFTTSVLDFAQGKIGASFDAQPASAIFCSLAVVTAFFAFLIAAFGIYSPLLARRIAAIRLRYVFIVLALILIAGWVFTLTKALSTGR